MFLELERDEHRMLIALIEGKQRQIRQRIGGAGEGDAVEVLRHDLDVIERVLHRLHEAECDVKA